MKLFKKSNLFFFILLVIIGYNMHTSAHTYIKSTADTTKAVQYPDTPDFAAHLAPLLSFFERNKSLPAFDTDIFFDDQGFGPIDHYYNFIHAGHIFSKNQIHALLFYDIGVKDYMPLARMVVYKKGASGTPWYKVLDDTCEVFNYYFKYRDWNGDGIKDLSYEWDGWEGGGHGPVSWHLWLTDKNGLLHKVNGFEDIDDPQIDSLTNHVFSNSVWQHTAEEMAEYKFSGNHIIKISDDMVVEYDNPDTVFYYRNGDMIKKRKLKHGQQLYLPKQDEGEDIK